MKNLNLIISNTKSFHIRNEGKDVAIFKAEKPIEKELELIGFKKLTYKEQSTGRMIFGGNYWNENSEELVHVNGDEWTLATEKGIVCESKEGRRTTFSLQ